MVCPYSSIAPTWKKSYFILSEGSDFYMINNLLIAVYAFPMCMLTLLSADEIMLPKYVKWSTNFRGLPLKVEILKLYMVWICDVIFHLPYFIVYKSATRVFANGPGDLGSIPGRVIPKTLKMVLDTTLLNTQHYKVQFKGKVEQSWEWSSALPYTLV